MAPPIPHRPLDRQRIISQFFRGLDVQNLDTQLPELKSAQGDLRDIATAIDDPTDTVIRGAEDVNELADYILGQTPATRGESLSPKQLERALTLYRSLSLEMARQHGLSAEEVGMTGRLRSESPRVSVGIGSRGTGGQRRPLQPATNPETRRSALETVRAALDTRALLDWGVSESEVRTAVDAISVLSADDARAVLRTLHQEGLLDKLAQSLETRGGSLAETAVRTRFAETMSAKLDGTTLAMLAQSMRKGGELTRAALVNEINRRSSVQTKLDFVRAAAGATTDGTPAPSHLDVSFGVSTHTRFKSDGDAASVAGVISSLVGHDVIDALGLLSPAQRASVYRGAANIREVMTTAAMGLHGASSHHTDADTAGFAAFIDAVGSISDRQVRAQYFSESFTALGLGEGRSAGSHLTRDRGSTRSPLGDDVPMHDRAALATRVMRHLDNETLSRLSPDGVIVLAEGLAHIEGGPASALHEINGFKPTPQRDALVRAIFLKTPQHALRDHPELVEAFAKGLAAGHGSPTASQSRSAEILRRALSTPNGRALLADANLPGTARLWAARALMKGVDPVRGALSVTKPWEDADLLKAHAQARVDQFARRGDHAVKVQGGNINNLIGAGLRAPTRPDLPQTKASIVRAIDEGYNFYKDIDVVRRIAGDPNQDPPGGIRGAAKQMGGEPIRVATLPIQFSSQASGPIELQLYRVEGRNGQERFVDNVGRIYASFAAWRTENELPPGRVTFPAHGHLGEPGKTELITENTPNVSDTFWEHVGDVADVAALGGGIVASGIILVGSGGTATPAVVAAWAVALGSAGHMGLRAGMDLYDRQAHGQTLSVSDPDARAAWLSLAGSGLTVVGGGSMGTATQLARNGSRWAPAVARTAGILDTSANVADASASLDQARTLVAEWDRLTPAERVHMGLTIAFWGGMVGVSAKASGGRVTDAFSFPAQLNSALIESGAAVRTNPNMAPGHARVITGYARKGRLNVSVEYGPGTSPISVDIHRRVARSLIDNSGVQGAIRRFLGEGVRFKPGTRGEEVALEVAQHRALVQAFDEQIPRTPVEQRPALTAERDAYEAALRQRETELLALHADRSAPAQSRGQVAAKELTGEALRTATKEASAWPLFRDEMTAAITTYTAKGLPLSIADPSSGVMGEYSRAFAQTLSLGDAAVIPFSSGTNALMAAYRALGIKHGDEAAVAGYTFHATGTPLVGLGAKVRLMDADENDGNLTLEIVTATLDKYPNLKVLALNHNWGAPVADIAEITKLLQERGVKLVEDSSHAHGARVHGRSVGTFGDVAVFSTQDNKIIPTGEGGMLVTRDPEVKKKVLLHGFYRAKAAYGGDLPDSSLRETGMGHGKMRMTAWTAVAGLVQLKHFASVRAQRKAAYDRFEQATRDVPFLSVYKAPEGIDPAVYGIRVEYLPEKNGGKSAEDFVRELQAQGVEVHVGTSVPLSHQKLFQNGDSSADSLPGANAYVRNRVVFPVLAGDLDQTAPIIDAWIRAIRRQPGRD